MAKKRIEWDEAASASANSRIRLPALVQSYFDQGRKLLDPSSSPSAMHRFRLETKAFRYTLELFRPCYGPALDGYLGGLREIQDCLGALNDCAATRDLIAERLPTHDPEREKIEAVSGCSGEAGIGEVQTLLAYHIRQPRPGTALAALPLAPKRNHGPVR